MSKSERTKAEILDKAWDLVADRGAAVSMSDIAKSAGITRQLLHLYFGSRGGLLFELVKRADRRFAIWEEFDAAWAIPDAPTCLDAVLTAWLHFLPKIRPVATDLIRLRATDPDAAAAWQDRMDALLSFYLRLTTRFQEEGVLAPDLSPEVAADFIWATSSMAYWSLLVGERGWSEEQAGALIRSMIAQRLFKAGMD